MPGATTNQRNVFDPKPDDDGGDDGDYDDDNDDDVGDA